MAGHAEAEASVSRLEKIQTEDSRLYLQQKHARLLRQQKKNEEQQRETRAENERIKFERNELQVDKAFVCYSFSLF
jgi:hypothetical protein